MLGSTVTSREEISNIDSTNMKNFLVMVACAVALAACTTKEEVEPQTSQYVRFYPLMTRATETQFEQGDQISISAVHPTAGTELKTSGNYADNIPYVFSGGMFVPEKEDGIKLPLGEESGLAYYAVYPQQDALATEGTFTVQQDQREHKNRTLSDFCTVFVPTTGNKDVYLKFWHRMSRICVDLTGITIQPVTMQLKNMSLEVAFDLNANTYASTGGGVSDVYMSMESNKRFEAILPPQDFNITTDIIVTIDGRDYNVTSTRSADVFRTGMEYDYRLIYIDGEIRLVGEPVEVAIDGEIYPWSTSDIPSDGMASENPTVNQEDTNTDLPNFNYTVTKESGWYVIRLDMTGVRDPYTNDWVKLYGTGDSRQNIWLSVDNKPKGFTISNTADAEGAQQRKAVDLVFLVDNSGSMSEEANTLAAQVMEWSRKLSMSGLDIQFGCVGYDGAITGAINLTTIDKLTEYLSYSTGVERTRHFGGADASVLSSKVEPYRTGGNSANECGAAALRFADEQFTFRTGANRVYVNFTDEPNQPNNKPEYSTEWVKDAKNWPATKGTIHTVFSSGSNWTETVNYREFPWNLSTYTGGTVIYTSSSFSGVNLDDLPVTGALQNSYIIRFSNVENLFDGQEHDVHITIMSDSTNGLILADKTYKIIFEKP